MAKDKKTKAKKDANGFKAELKKVSWPKMDVLSKSTGAVLFLVIIVALIIFVSDTIFVTGSNKFTDYVVNKNKPVEQKVEQKTEEKKNESEKKEENTEAKEGEKPKENTENKDKKSE